MKSHAFPLPVDHSRAPWSVSRRTFLLAITAAFASGFAVAVYTVGLITTAP